MGSLGAIVKKCYKGSIRDTSWDLLEFRLLGSGFRAFFAGAFGGFKLRDLEFRVLSVGQGPRTLKWLAQEKPYYFIKFDRQITKSLGPEGLLGDRALSCVAFAIWEFPKIGDPNIVP